MNSEIEDLDKKIDIVFNRRWDKYIELGPNDPNVSYLPDEAHFKSLIKELILNELKGL